MIGSLERIIPLVIVLLAVGASVALRVARRRRPTPEALDGAEPAASASDWPSVRRTVGNALDLSPERRRAYLEEACRDRPSVRREVESLLEAHEWVGLLDCPPRVLGPASGMRDAAVPSLNGSAPHYELMDRIGGGGMGVVYRARDRRLERVAALKFLPAHLVGDEEAKERFLVEARAAAALDHPNICTIYEAGETDDGHLYLAMPFYDGETLRDRMRAAPLAVSQCLDIGIQVGHGLAWAHGHGIVHRDIKPANLVLAGEGLVKILDFGVARRVGSEVTRPGTAMGTLAYMSPEQAEGSAIDERSDLWSLGVVMFEMLTGRRPFADEGDAALLHAIATAEPPRMADLRRNVPAAVEDVVTRALAKRPADRFSSATEMVAALEAVRDGTLTGRRVGTASAGGVLPEGERRQATVVVSALTAYDELVERHVPDRLDRLLGHLREQAQGVALAHGGILNEFTGDRIVMLFGVPLAREDDAHRATRAALELQERVAGLDGETPVRLHTGIDTGIVVTHGLEGGEPPFRVTGGPPQAASRIADQAEAGEVWVSAECRSAISPFYELVAREAIKLRGRDRALEPYRVLGESGLQTKIDASERTGLTAFTGRAAELQELERCLEEALAGEGRLIIVSGDAGLGKSRLLHEFRKGLMAIDVPVLVGRCQPYGGGVAYLPFIEILRDGMRLASGVDELIERVREISAALEEFIPLYAHLLALRSTAHPVPRHLQGDAFRLAMQEALAAFVTLRAQRTAVVIVLEDWHWADDASQGVLRQIAEVLQEYPILVLVSSRPGYGVTWDNFPGVTRVLLNLLPEDGTDQMLRSVLRAREVDGALVGLIHERTAGNPFYIEEICQALVEEGAVVVVDGAGRLAAPPQLLDLPDSIQSVIRARLDRLEREARDVLKLASVVGREFARSVLERALDDAGHLQHSLDALKAAGLVRQMTVAPDPRYRFKHVLTQEVAYASLLEHQRRELHGRVGAVMEAMHGEHTDDQLDRLAHHFSRAGAWEKAVTYGLRSAAAADRLAQFAESLQILERTQRWLARFPEGDTRDRALVDILLRQERLCETLGQRNRQQQLIDELIRVLGESDDRAHLAELYLRQGDLHTLLGSFDRADRALQQSLELRRALEDPVGERNTLRSIGLLRWHEGRNAEALAVAEETLRLDRERGDLAAIVGDMTNCGAILRAMGEHERARDVLEEALAFGDQAAVQSGGDGDDFAMKRIYALQHLANIHREQGDRAAALECLHRAGTYAESKRLPIQLVYNYTTLAHVYLQEGEVEACLSYYRDAIELSRKARHAPGLAVTLRIYGEVLTGLGKEEDALPPLYEAASLFADLRDVEGEAAAHRDIAEGAESLGRFAEAVAAWGRAVELRRKIGHRAGELVAIEGLARTTRAHVSEPTLALMHYRTAAELAQEIEDASAEGRLRNVMGILEWQRGEFGLALEQYEQARRLFGSIGDPHAAALMLNSIGATLRALGRAQEAEERLQDALETHRRHGFGQLEGHALALLADISADRDDMRAAAGHYRRSLEIRRRIGDVRGEGWMLHGLARCELARGEPFRVREHAAVAARIAEECGDHELALACASLRRIAD